MVSSLKNKCFTDTMDCPSFVKRLGAGGHLDLAPRQSLCEVLKILKIYSWRDGKSSWAKPPSQPVNLPSARPLNETSGSPAHTKKCLNILL